MAVRPSQKETSDSEPTEFGIAALHDHLEEADISYPIKPSDLVQILNDPVVPFDAYGRTVSLSEIIPQTSVEEFDSEQEVLNALHPLFEAKRESRAIGFFTVLRSLLRF